MIAMLNTDSNTTDEAMNILKGIGTDTLVVRFPFALQVPMPMPAPLGAESLFRDVADLEHLVALDLYSVLVIFHGCTSNVSIAGASAGLVVVIRL